MFDNTAAQWLAELADDVKHRGDGAEANAWVAVWDERPAAASGDASAQMPVTAYYAAAYPMDALYYGS